MILEQRHPQSQKSCKNAEIIAFATGEAAATGRTAVTG